METNKKPTNKSLNQVPSNVEPKPVDVPGETSHPMTEEEFLEKHPHKRDDSRVGQAFIVPFRIPLKKQPGTREEKS
jgi:hypothetical protein